MELKESISMLAPGYNPVEGHAYILIKDNQFYYADEAYDVCGPYDTVKLADAALHRYCALELEGEDPAKYDARMKTVND